MKRSKHAVSKSKSKSKKKRTIIVVATIIIAILIIYFIISLRNSNNEESVTENIIEEEVPQNEVTEKDQESFEMVDVSDMPTKKGGYGVLGKIVIEKIDVENYILNETTDASLNLAVTWFWGPDPYNRTVNDIRKY